VLLITLFLSIVVQLLDLGSEDRELLALFT